MELCWRKALELKSSYALERRKAFQPRLVVQEYVHYEILVKQTIQDTLAELNLSEPQFNLALIIKMVLSTPNLD